MLTDHAIKGAKPKDKPYKMTDEKGMYLLINPNGGKYFRFDYRFGDKRKKLSFGVYPEVSLKMAREKRDNARKALAAGNDPGVIKKKVGTTFKTVFEEWVLNNQAWSKSYRDDVINRVDNHILPFIGNINIAEITHEHLIRIIERLKLQKLHSNSAKKIYNHINSVYQYGIAKRVCDRNIAVDVKPLLPTGSPTTKRVAVTTEELPMFWEKLKNYRGRIETTYALQFMIWTASRPKETYAAKWCEIDFDKGIWTIPFERMKARRIHTVPLQTQAMEMLNILKDISGHTEYLFPNMQHTGKHMGENTLKAAIHALGFMATAHGFRATFSTVMNEQGFRPDVIEVALAHVDSSIRGIYNRTEYFEERKAMMQWWADYLKN